MKLGLLNLWSASAVFGLLFASSQGVVGSDVNLATVAEPDALVEPNEENNNLRSAAGDQPERELTWYWSSGGTKNYATKNWSKNYYTKNYSKNFRYVHVAASMSLSRCRPQ